MTAFTSRRVSFAAADEYEPEVVEADTAEILGTAFGKQFARLADGREVQILGQREPWEAANTLHPNQLLVQRREVTKRSDQPFAQEHVIRFVARIVEAGSYEAAVERERAVQAERGRLPARRRADALGHLSLLAHKQPNPGVVRSADVMAPFTMIGSADSREPIRGAAAIVAVLANKGVTLQLDPGAHYVVPISRRGALSSQVREVLREAESLLRAHLSGSPLRCALEHAAPVPEAVTLLEGGAPCCATHLDEELPE